MASVYPTTLDNFPNPSPTDLVENVTPDLDHNVQHSNANDAIENIEAFIGISAAPAGAGTLVGRIKTLEAAGSGTPAYCASPTLQGFLDWTAEPYLMAGPAYLTVSGTMAGTGFTAGKSQSITSIIVNATNTGTATAAYACIYSAAGALIVQSTSAHAQFGSAGLKTFTIASTALTAGTNYYATVWLVTSSAPGLWATGPDGNGDTWANLNRTSANYRAFSANTGLTNTAPATIGTRSIARMIWFAFA